MNIRIYERTRIPSRFVPVRPGPPAANCRDAPGCTPGHNIQNTCIYLMPYGEIKFSFMTFEYI